VYISLVYFLTPRAATQGVNWRSFLVLAIRASLMLSLYSNRRAMRRFAVKKLIVIFVFIVISKSYLSGAGLAVGCGDLTCMTHYASYVFV
jgi:hypothetical protein